MAATLLVATGRTPNSDRLGLEHLDLQPSDGGFLEVDDQLRTTTEGVWALGDLRADRCSPTPPATTPTSSPHGLS